MDLTSFNEPSELDAAPPAAGERDIGEDCAKAAERMIDANCAYGPTVPREDELVEDELGFFVAPLAGGRREIRFFLPSLNCAGCMRKIERHFEQTLSEQRHIKEKTGLSLVRVNLGRKEVRFEWRGDALTGAALAAELAALGFEGRPLAPDETQSEVGDKELRQLIWCLAVAGFAAANVMLLSVSVWSGASGATRDLFHWLSALIAIPAIAYAGRPFFSSAFAALKTRRLNMDVPISLAVVLAAGLSLYETAQHGSHAFFDAALCLLFFLLIGRVLDRMMRERAFAGVRQLLALKRSTVEVIEADGRRRTVAVRALQPGMIVAIAPGETIPVDGRVMDGVSDVDWALVNGESVPRRARVGDQLYSGLINLTGPIRMRAEAVGEATLLSEIIRLMEQVGKATPKYQRLADKAAAIYAPVVHLAALITFIGWLLAGRAVHDALYIAISVLIITCPCALGLAVPVVQVVASSIAFRRGILMKDGSALEMLGQVDRVIFDKTGTLTCGRPELSGTYFEALDLLEPAAELARGSLHPLSKALAGLVPEGGAVTGPLTRRREEPGEGLEGYFGETRLRLGRLAWCGIPMEAAAKHLTAEDEAGLSLWVSSLDEKGELRFGLFSFEDTLRPGAVALTQWLRQRGLPMTLLSGDRTGATARMAARLKIDDYKGEMKPAEKADYVAACGAGGAHVLMIGDGINDGPSLKAASVSATPQSASDVAQVTAGFVIMGRSLLPMIGLMRLSEQTKWVIGQNFALAALYNLIAVPLAVFGGVTPIVAAIAMSASSILVTLNALRLTYLARPSTWGDDEAEGMQGEAASAALAAR